MPGSMQMNLFLPFRMKLMSPEIIWCFLKRLILVKSNVDLIMQVI